jgi:hypothetical protein
MKKSDKLILRASKLLSENTIFDFEIDLEVKDLLIASLDVFKQILLSHEELDKNLLTVTSYPEDQALAYYIKVAKGLKSPLKVANNFRDILADLKRYFKFNPKNMSKELIEITEAIVNELYNILIDKKLELQKLLN